MILDAPSSAVIGHGGTAASAWHSAAHGHGWPRHVWHTALSCLGGGRAARPDRAARSRLTWSERASYRPIGLTRRIDEMLLSFRAWSLTFR